MVIALVKKKENNTDNPFPITKPYLIPHNSQLHDDMLNCSILPSAMHLFSAVLSGYLPHNFAVV